MGQCRELEGYFITGAGGFQCGFPDERGTEKGVFFMTTAEEIFTMAIHLMDQQNDATGAAAGREVAVYRTRALSVLNGILPALRPFSDAGPEGPGRPPCPPLTAFSQAVPVDDALARGVLPYALAAHLLAGEDSDLSLWFQRQYALQLAELQAQTPGRWEAISMPYGAF
jgi:hypothetical protein